MRGRQLYDYFMHTFKENDYMPSTFGTNSIESAGAFTNPSRIYIDPTSQNLYQKSYQGVPTAFEKPRLQPKIETNELTGEVTVSIPMDENGETMQF